MKLVELESGDWTMSIVFAALAAVAIISMIVMVILTSAGIDLGFGGVVGVAVLIFLGLVGAIGGSLAIPNLSDSRAAQLKEVKDDIQDRYDIKLSKVELKNLDYPRGEPEEDFEVFGTVTRNVELKGGFERQEISLVWRNDRFELAQSNDGQGFTDLKPRGESNDRGSVSDEPFFAPSSAATEKPSDD